MSSGDRVMPVYDIDQQDGCLNANLGVVIPYGQIWRVNKNEPIVFYSTEFIVNGIFLEMRIDAYKSYQASYNYILFIKTTEKNTGENDAAKFKLNFSSKTLFVEKQYSTNNREWHKIVDYSGSADYNLDVSIKVEIDKYLEVCGDGGSISVHKAVLAASSDVLKTMLCGDWKEKETGHVSIPCISKQTLEHFKAYLYLRSMPDDGFQELLLLASYYMMPELEKKCIDMIVGKLNAKNVLGHCEFAVKNKMHKLHRAILERVQAGQVSVRDIPL
ncbi:BTB/POZ domain-containing protein [Phthorimaea operculella]|nr:BTB/POZ domain-containing protein [Phthorimaea operculella]